jgi:hypothetical protein
MLSTLAPLMGISDNYFLVFLLEDNVVLELYIYIYIYISQLFLYVIFEKLVHIFTLRTLIMRPKLQVYI